ncbi:MAG: alpha/beta fold hydrolase [Candidatus Firestonebacteria bacterium]|nr:alpha/beta fold hydrolase [Candidatus Firestonebacteria bacterium]
MENAALVKMIVIRAVVYGLILLLVFTWIFSTLLISAYRPKNSDSPAVFNISFENIFFTAADRVVVNGWWVENKTNDKCIILCHGLGADKSDMLNYIPFLYKKGYSLLAFDFRGHGGSKEKCTSLGYNEVKDLLAAVEFAKNKGAKRIGVIGRSMGAAACIRTAEVSPDILAVVADSSFARLELMIRHYARKFYHIPYFPLVPMAELTAKLRTGFKYETVNPVESVSRTKTPLLIFHGEADKNISPANAQMIYDASPGPKKLILVKGADHLEAFSTDQLNYEKEVLAFFGKYLK